MTAEQARERADAATSGTMRNSAVAKVARELLLAQAEAYEDAARQVGDRADECLERAEAGSRFFRGARNNLCGQAVKLQAKAAELRRAAEEITRG
jgi:hypothetical protein